MEVGILMAVYNGEKYISEQLDSLLHQTYSDFICYIHDDGSKDRTMQICEEYVQRYPDKFRILTYPASGSAKQNFMSMLQYASEPYIMFCDQDDVWVPEKIEKTLGQMKKNEMEYGIIPILVYTDMMITDCELHVIAESGYSYMRVNPKNFGFRESVYYGYAAGCTCMLNRTLYSKLYKNIDVSAIVMHDMWAVIAAFALGGKVDMLDEALILYRQHETNCVGFHRPSQLEILRNGLYGLISGSLKKQKKERLNAILRQSMELNKLPDITLSSREFLEHFEAVQKKSKAARIVFYYRNFKNVPRIRRSLMWV